MSSYRGQPGWVAQLIARSEQLIAALGKNIDDGGRLRGTPDNVVGIFPSDAGSVVYDPNDPTDWDTPPDDLAEAADELADRVTAVEGAAGHSSSEITDADLDTHVKAEVTPDADQIDMTVAGTLKARLEAVGLQLPNAADIEIYADNFLTKHLTIDGSTGHIQIGSGSPSALTAIGISEMLSPTGANSAAAHNQSVVINATGNLSGLMTSNIAILNLSGDALAAHVYSGIVSGFRSQIHLVSLSQITANDVRNFYAIAVANSTTTMVNRYAAYLANATGSGTLDNQYMLYIETPTKGVTLNRAIYSAGGDSVLGGRLRIGSIVAPTVELDVTGAVNISGLLTPGGLIIPVSASPAQTAEGSAVWDTDDDLLTVGDASARKVFDYEDEVSIVVTSPDASENLTIRCHRRGKTLTRVRVVLRGSATPSVTWNLAHSDDRSDVTPTEVWNTDKTTTSTTTGDTFTSFDNGVITADHWLWLVINSKSGTVDEITVHLTYRNT